MDKVIAELEPDTENRRFHIHIREGVTPAESKIARDSGTMSTRGMTCPNPDCPGHLSPIPMATIRREQQGGLRLWENDDIVPRPDDVFQERLYCIRWKETVEGTNGREQTCWHFRAPTPSDLAREEKVLALLDERFSDWQELGYVPSMKIEPGEETTRLFRERGWTHWHHLFSPRQLLYHGFLVQTGMKIDKVHLKIAFLANLI